MRENKHLQQLSPLLRAPQLNCPFPPQVDGLARELGGRTSCAQRPCASTCIQAAASQLQQPSACSVSKNVAL